MMKKVGLLPLVASLAVVSACSDSNSRSGTVTTIAVNIQVNQEDMNNALVRSQAIGESGLPATNIDQQPVVATVVTDAEGQVRINIPAEEIQQFQLVGRIANTATDTKATTRKCQLAAGCGTGIAFGREYEQATGLEWRSVVYKLAKDERARITPLTELAAELGIHRIYNETYNQASGSNQTNVWDSTGFYSPYSVVQSVSQISRIFGIDNIQTREPADLTQLNEWGNTESAAAQFSIRYGAILAAWQQLALDYTTANPNQGTLAQAVGKDLVGDAHPGQLMQAGGTETISVEKVLTLAASNLAAVAVSNSVAADYVNAVVQGLQNDATALQANVGQATTVTPEQASVLLGSEYATLELGIKRSKAFLQTLRNYRTDFFEAGYTDRITAYIKTLRAVGSQNQQNLNALMQALMNTKELYIECLQNGGSCPAHPEWSWLSNASFSNNVLSLNNGTITVSQAVADVDPTDGVSKPAQSQAIDLLIKGQYVFAGMTFTLEHTYQNNDKTADIISPSGIRIFYPQEVTAIQTDVEEIGYELRWADFNLYANTGVAATTDAAGNAVASETEIEGAFSLLYEGVTNPQDASAERRFNIAAVALNGRISDKIDGDNSDDRRVSLVNVTASASNADQFYPDRKFASFNGFLKPTSLYSKGSRIANLVSYELGNEALRGQRVEYFDFRVAGGTSYRYRFYPDTSRTDENDQDRDGNRTDTIVTHDFERCELTETSGNWSVSRCDPKQRLLAQRDLQQSLNDLWEVGTFSRITLEGQGTYFVSWPTTPVVATSGDQCLNLTPLNGSGNLDGVLYQPSALGLSATRFSTEIFLNDDNDATSDPNTLLDVSLQASSTESYQVTAALSHDYSAKTSADVILGTGADLDRVILSYNTTGEIANSGSLAVYKDGVSLTIDEATQTVDSELTAFVQQQVGSASLPYKFITDDEGQYNRCVLSNTAEVNKPTGLDQALIPLNFRDVVYGRIQKENNVWLVRFINGEFQTLM